MKQKQRGETVEKLLSWVKKYKLALLVLAAGILLLLWPGSGAIKPALEPSAAESAGFDPADTEKKLERVLSLIDGAGEVSVALTVKDGGERLYATDRTSKKDGAEEQTQTVLVSTGSGTQAAVPVSERMPSFQGAVVVCQGGDDPEIRLLITKAVCSLTGLGADKVTVCKGS